MIMDSLLLFSKGQDLTTATAGTALASSNFIDFSQDTDLGPTEGIKAFATFTSLPTSATAGATISVALQVSSDGQTWSTLEDFPAIALADVTDSKPFALRAKPAFSNTVYRYMRLTYTVSAALTSGIITAGLNMDVPGQHSYARNYVA